ncbi:MAG: acylphosphatase [Proteobacteria bacterium]|nr:acylphosphatase [Pseudomonadota bacterium]HQR04174.1 acylphosphatase [Rhodocyclaceae bacterium]
MLTPEIRHLTITGRVQGVFYRASMVAEARHLGATGWVRNRADGSVEALICGPAESVAQLIAWARRGPPDARVESVLVEAASGEFVRFEQWPDA